MLISPINNFSTNIQNYRSSKSLNTEHTRTIKTVSFTGEDYFNYDDRLREKLKKRSGFQKLFGLLKQKLKDETTSELIGFNINQEALLKEKDQTIKAKEASLKAKEEALQIAREKADLLAQQLHDAKNNSIKDETITKLKKELAETEQKRIAAEQELKEESAKIIKIKTEQSLLKKREAGKGWSKIAGCEILKSQLEEAFINKLAQEKAGYDVRMPNGILLYGQPGTGKTRFAKAFAEQAQCNFVEIDMMEDENIINSLYSALKKSKNDYNSKETPKKRTIILLDDFDSIASISDKEKEDNVPSELTNVGRLAKFLDDCADKYKATIIMTTNYPREMDSELLSSNRIPYQIFLGPPNSLNAAKMFKYHLDGFTNQDIDYIKLGNKVARAIENDTAYSAQGIVNVVNDAKDKCRNSQITEDDLLKSIDNVKPDITPETFNDFIDDMSEMLEKFNKDKNEV